MITVATATRQGTSENNADGAAVFTSAHGSVAAAVVDLIGHHPNAPLVARLLAETAVRIAPQRGTVAALMTAGMLVADRGSAPEPEPNGVAVVALRRPGGTGTVAWIGDSHAYGWDGTRLTRYTTPHTMTQHLHTRFGLDMDVAAGADHIITTALSEATAATVAVVPCPDPLLILASDGLDAIDRDQLTQLVAAHAADPQALATALVQAPGEDADGYRDDVTIAVIRHDRNSQ